MEEVNVFIPDSEVLLLGKGSRMCFMVDSAAWGFPGELTCETAPPNELAMARFVFEQLGGRCKLVDKDFFVRCTDEEIAVAERLKAEKVRKMKQREERHQARSEEEWKKVQNFLEAHHFSAVNAAKISWWGLSRTYPLHVASKEGNFEVMLLLMKYGADPKQRDGRGKTAIAYTQLALRK